MLTKLLNTVSGFIPVIKYGQSRVEPDLSTPSHYSWWIHGLFLYALAFLSANCQPKRFSVPEWEIVAAKGDSVADHQPSAALSYYLKAYNTGENEVPSKQKISLIRKITRTYRAIGKHNDGILFLQRAYHKAILSNDTSLMLTTTIQLASLYRNLLQTDSLFTLISKAHFLYNKKPDTSQKQDLFFNLAASYHEIGDYKNAIQCYNILLEEKSGNSTGELNDAAIRNNLAILYDEMGKQKPAISITLETSKLYLREGKIRNYYNSMLALGSFYCSFIPDSALYYNLLATDYFFHEGDSLVYYKALYNRAIIYRRMGEYSKCEEILCKAKKHFVATENKKGFFLATHQMALVCISMHNYSKALELLQQADSLMQSSRSFQYSDKLLLTKVAALKGANDFKEALAVYESYFKLTDSLKDAKLDRDIERILLQHKVKTYISEILNKEDKLRLALKLKHSYLITSITAAVLIAALITGIVFYSRWNRRRRIRLKMLLLGYRTEFLKKKIQRDEKETENEHALSTILHFASDTNILSNSQLTAPLFAELCDLTPTGLSALLQKHFAMRFPAFIARQRVEYAKKLLISPEYLNIKIDFIGLKAGFGSCQSFFSSFQQFAGTTPAQFRASHQKNYNETETTSKPDPLLTNPIPLD